MLRNTVWTWANGAYKHPVWHAQAAGKQNHKSQHALPGSKSNYIYSEPQTPKGGYSRAESYYQSRNKVNKIQMTNNGTRVVKFQIAIDGIRVIKIQLTIKGTRVITFQMAIDGTTVFKIQMTINGTRVIKDQMAIDGTRVIKLQMTINGTKVIQFHIIIDGTKAKTSFPGPELCYQSSETDSEPECCSQKS